MNTQAILEAQSHRQWPVPDAPWLMAQTWERLLFAHWPVDPGQLAPHVPRGVTLDLFDGQAWLGITPFRVRGARLRMTPAIPGISSFPEINVRTYVTRDDRPGVLFLSLDAGSGLAVEGARALYALPYYNADIDITQEGDTIWYRHRRAHPGAPDARFEARYRPISPPRTPEPGTLEHFLVERYCLYVEHQHALYRGEIQHPPWHLQDAEAEILINDLAESHRVTLPAKKPLTWFAARQDTLIWREHRVDT